MNKAAAPTNHRIYRRVRALTGLGVLAALSAGVGRVPAAVIVPAMVVLLAGVDIIGAIVAKSWAADRSGWTFALGAAIFVLLFWIYGVSLRHGELTTVTIAWVVIVTVGDMLLDRFHYGTHFPTSKWVAAATAVGLLVYLLAGPSGQPPRTEPAHASVDAQLSTR